MSIVNSVNRLDRTGNRNSEAWQKLYKAVDELGEHLRGIFPNGHILPDGVNFKCWPAGQYQFEHKDFTLGDQRKLAEEVLKFSQLVHSGWLDRISDFLEEESQELESSAQTIADWFNE